uniref:Uncharacterized protein n=1 Tax=Emiliania huxleyi TaxID=2903 RepID=A0A7S3S387_EMIHU
MGGGWAAWPRCWPTRWRAVVLCMFLALTATATLTAEQEEELVTLIDASASAVAHLPTTSRARDEIRLLHGKLTELQAAAATVTPEEWDIMLRALLRANHYGVAALREALAAEGLQEQLPLAAAHDDVSAGVSASGPRACPPSPSHRRGGGGGGSLGGGGGGGDGGDGGDGAPLCCASGLPCFFASVRCACEPSRTVSAAHAAAASAEIAVLAVGFSGSRWRSNGTAEISVHATIMPLCAQNKLTKPGVTRYSPRRSRLPRPTDRGPQTEDRVTPTKMSPIVESSAQFVVSWMPRTTPSIAHNAEKAMVNPASGEMRERGQTE